MSYQTSIAIKLGDKIYEAPYPTVKDELDIENLKLYLTNGKYGDFARSGHITALRMLDLVDAISTFVTIIPDIRKTFKLDDFHSLSPEIQKTYVKAYKKVYGPWMLNMREEMFKEEDDDEEEMIKKILNNGNDAVIE